MFLGDSMGPVVNDNLDAVQFPLTLDMSFITASAPGHILHPEECEEVHGDPGMAVVATLRQMQTTSQCTPHRRGAQRQRGTL